MHTLSVLEIVGQLISVYHQYKQRKTPRKIDNIKEYNYQFIGRFIHHYLEVPKVRYVGLYDKLEYLYKYNYVTEVSVKIPFDYLLLENETTPSTNLLVAAVIDRIELIRNKKRQVTGIRICEVKTHKSVRNCYTTNNHKYQVRLYGLLVDAIQRRYHDIFPNNSKLHNLITCCFPLNAKITLRVNHVEQIMAQRAILLQQDTIYCKSDTVQSKFTNLRIKLQGLKWII
jgi:hypothetical protein